MTAMGLLLAALGALGCGGALSALLGRVPAVAGGLLGAAAGIAGLAAAPSLRALPWGMPGAELALRVDGLAAFFFVPVSLVVALAAIYAVGYTRKGRFGWLWYDTLAAAMLLVLAAADGVLFLVASRTPPWRRSQRARSLTEVAKLATLAP